MILLYKKNAYMPPLKPKDKVLVMRGYTAKGGLHSRCNYLLCKPNKFGEFSRNAPSSKNAAQLLDPGELRLMFLVLIFV